MKNVLRVTLDGEWSTEDLSSICAEIGGLGGVESCEPMSPFTKHTFPSFFIFGEYPDGFVDVSDGQKDVLTHVTRDQAEALIAERQKLINLLIKTTASSEKSEPSQ